MELAGCYSVLIIAALLGLVTVAIRLVAQHLDGNNDNSQLLSSSAGTGVNPSRASSLSLLNPTRPGRRRAKVGPRCIVLYEYSSFLGVLNNVTYTGSHQPESNIGQFNTPLFDNPDLDGPPVAQLRGSYLLDVVAKYATYTTAAHFFDPNDAGYFLVLSLGFSTSILSKGLGVVIGGTGPWSNYIGTVRSEPYNSSRLSAASAKENQGSRQIVFEYTICPSP
jgi:hypothetical protein